jgi:hypothetical protein
MSEWISGCSLIEWSWVVCIDEVDAGHMFDAFSE